MARSPQPAPAARRVERHRRKAALEGVRRLEVVVPDGDADSIRQVAATLRGGGESAVRMRSAIARIIGEAGEGTGADFVARLRAPPFEGTDLRIERDPAPMRRIRL